MFTSNPFAELSSSVSPAVMQTFVVVMALLVAGGTLFEIIHKKGAPGIFSRTGAVKKKAKQPTGGGEMISIAVQTAAVDVLACANAAQARSSLRH